MKTDLEALESKLTRASVEAFQNSRIFAYARVGIIWIAERRGDGFYTFDSVGIPKMGIRRLTAEVQRIALKH